MVADKVEEFDEGAWDLFEQAMQWQAQLILMTL
jgi:hypothetical protein